MHAACTHQQCCSLQPLLVAPSASLAPLTYPCVRLLDFVHQQVVLRSCSHAVPKDAQATATDPRAAYAALVHLLQKPPKPPTSGVKRKAGRASSTSNSYSTPATGGKHACLILLDEVDRLLNRKDGEQDLLQLFSLSKLNGKPAGSSLRLGVHAFRARKHGLARAAC